MNKNELKPASVFEQFAKINEIPRPSKREEKMIEYLRQWGESRGLETKVDETGNVLIRKPATPGYEDRKTVILQSHMSTANGCAPRAPRWAPTTASAAPSNWPSSTPTTLSTARWSASSPATRRPVSAVPRA